MSSTTTIDGSSEALTRGVRVRVRAEYLSEQSDPGHGLWFYVYHVVVVNEGDEAAQLISRHWIITNAEGNEEHVRGPGVVGEQPVLNPGQSFSYTSGCPLDTPSGTMHGTYQMITRGGVRFDAVIAPFVLAQPFAVN